MKKEIVVEVIVEEPNFYVIKVPNREYPGVLVQGDSLSDLFHTVKDALTLLESDKDEATAALKYLYEELEWRFNSYQEAIRENNSLPDTKNKT